MPGGTNLPVLGDLGRGSQTPYPYDAYPTDRLLVQSIWSPKWFYDVLSVLFNHPANPNWRCRSEAETTSSSATHVRLMDSATRTSDIPRT